jgi:hypothetical protein
MKTFNEYTLEEIEALIAAQALVNPESANMPDDVKADLVHSWTEWLSQKTNPWNPTGPAPSPDNIFNYKHFSNACGCMGPSNSKAHKYKYCRCTLSFYKELYRFHMMKHFKLNPIEE